MYCVTPDPCVRGSTRKNMLKQLLKILRPTNYKLVGSISFTLTYIVAAVIRIVTAGLLASFLTDQFFKNVFLFVLNAIVLVLCLYLTSFFIFSKKQAINVSWRRQELLIFVTVIGLLISPLFFEMPRFLSLIFSSFAFYGSSGALILIVVANGILTYVLFSLLLFFMDTCKTV